MSGQHFAIEVEQDLLGALMAHAGAIERIEADLQPAHFYRAEHQAIYAAIASLTNQGRSCDSMAVVDALEQSGQLERAGGFAAVVELEAESASAANVRRHAEIVIERAMARQLLAAADEIVAIAEDAATPVKERIDAAQKRIMALSDTATLGAREPQLVGDLMPKYLAVVSERWERKGGGISTGFPDLDRRLGGGLAEGSLVILAGRPSMGKAQPLDSKILLADGTWCRMGDIEIGDALASVDGAESRVVGVFPQGVKKIFRVSFSDGRSALACEEHLWRVRYRGWTEPRVIDTAKLIEMLGRARYKNRLSIDVVSGEFGGGNLPLDPYVLGVLLGDGNISGSGVRFSSADEEIVKEVNRRLGGTAEVRKICGKYDFSVVSRDAKGRAYEDGCELPYGRRYPAQLGHNKLQMRRPKIAYPVRDALDELGLRGLGSSEKFIPEVYFSASKEDRLELLRGLMDTDGWAEAHGSVRFTSSSRALSDGVQRLVRSLGGLCSITRKETTFTANGEKRTGMVAWVCRIRHERAEQFFRLERKAVRAVRTKHFSVRLNVARVEECGAVEAQCIQVSHPSRLYVTDDYAVTHNTALALQVAYNVADHGSTALVCSQEMQDTQLIDRAVSFVGRVPLAGLLTGEGLTADDHDKYQAALSRIAAAPLFLDEQGALKPADVRRKARKVKNRRGLAVLVIDYLQLMVGDKDGENRTREVTQITQDLKALAKELSCCVIALSQLNRQVESRPNKRPIMSDLRESGSIEQDADVILAPYRDEYYNADSRYQGLAELLVLKNRQGASGGFVPMSFQGEYTAFGSIFGDWPEEPAAHEKPKRKGRWDD